MAIRQFSTSSISTGTKKFKFWDQETFPGYFESIATVVVGSAGAANVEFTNIPNTYTHLQVRALARYSGTVGSGFLSFNGDTSSGNYSHHSVHGDGSSPGAIALATQNEGKYTGAAGTSPTQPNAMVMDILDYKDTNKYKTVRGLYCWDNNGSGYVEFFSNLWRSTSVITSIKFRPANTFDQYSHFALYGIRSA
jgi:hypothetical protein